MCEIIREWLVNTYGSSAIWDVDHNTIGIKNQWMMIDFVSVYVFRDGIQLDGLSILDEFGHYPYFCYNDPEFFNLIKRTIDIYLNRNKNIIRKMNNV